MKNIFFAGSELSVNAGSTDALHIAEKQNQKNTLNVNHYHPIQKLLHWMSALVILWATITGFSVAFGIFSEEYAKAIGNFNVSLTLLFVPFFVARIIFAIYFGKPVDQRFTKNQRTLINTMHFIIYVVISIVLISGVLMMERDIVFGSYFIFKPIIEQGDVTQAFLEIHRYSCIVLALLLFIHISAVFHHQVKGVNIIKKMSF
ncbi:cytochrome b/b6 domain-containing protein [Pseudoalteromonas sp. JBTF-M23]|uniref:Cytochrome b/b6 domain-containing protein n=1 Tax=Pseudoalteromonas caenipelagi TaxID=2726988 RepID=A0A849VBK3_9GAMM|nr:cytochrome b/b6 domain-containing protein [Pseudoalteromonas caenipelagi]NOU51019.1 cytochrome b/b6 domain-containing protein [Pseudoalteromonas caenipelagi]